MEMMLEIEPPFLVIKPDAGEEDFYRLAGEDDDWEYLDGRIVMHSPASPRHERLFRFLLALLEGFLSRRGGAEVLGSRLPMRLDPEWSPEPDLLVVLEDRRHLIGETRLEGRADLVIEIASPGDAHLLQKEKLPRYREAGIPEIWIVDPRRQEVLADRAGPDGRTVEVRAEGRSGRAKKEMRAKREMRAWKSSEKGRRVSPVLPGPESRSGASAQEARAP